MSHELAHQWFGNSVSLRAGDIWLNEDSRHTFAAWFQHTDPNHNIARALITAGRRTGANLDQPPGRPGSALFSASVYYRGAMTLHALRLEVGDETFRRILTTYATEQRDGLTDTPTFTETAQRLAGRSLDSLFAEWLDAAADPSTLG